MKDTWNKAAAQSRFQGQIKINQDSDFDHECNKLFMFFFPISLVSNVHGKTTQQLGTGPDTYAQKKKVQVSSESLTVTKKSWFPLCHRINAQRSKQKS